MNWQNAVQRFWAKVVRRGPGDCWLWTGATVDSGYGKFQVERKHWRTHVFSYVLAYGPVPVGLFVLHTCDVRPCVNPAHLYAVTKRQNRDDMLARGRQPRFDHTGVQNPNALLVEDAVRAIRKDTRPSLDVARAFGVSRNVVYDIKNGRTWGHVI